MSLTLNTLESSDLVSLILQAAKSKPDQPLYTFLDSNLKISDQLTCAQLVAQAKNIAGTLQSQGFAGEPVLLVYPHGAEFVVAFFGALLAGCVPVPVSYHRRLEMIDIDALILGTGLRTVMGPDDVLERIRSGRNARLLHAGDNARQLRYLLAHRHSAHDWCQPDVSDMDVAFIYPCALNDEQVRPLALSHRNVLASIAALTRQLSPDADDRLLACLDLADGMTLLLHILLPLAAQIPSGFLSMDDFMESPLLWLKAASEHRYTILNAPVSGLALCAHGVAANEEAGLELAGVRWICLGEGQIAPCLVEQFMERYGGFGLSRGSLFSCYGLSTTGSYISGRNGFHTSLIQGVPYLNQGDFLSDMQWHLNHGDESDAALTQGELVLKSPATGILCCPEPGGSERSGMDYMASLSAAARAGVHMMINTGERATVINDELYCLGRAAHRFCIADTLYQAEDVESAVMQAFGARGLSRCVVLVSDNSREAVLLAECATRQLAEHWQGVVPEMITSVAETTSLRLDRVLLLRPGSLLTGSNGVVLRKRCLAALQDGSLMLRLLPVRGK